MLAAHSGLVVAVRTRTSRDPDAVTPFDPPTDVLGKPPPAYPSRGSFGRFFVDLLRACRFGGTYSLACN